jgi:hypothetical protein
MRSKPTRTGWRDRIDFMFHYPFKADWRTQDGNPQASGLQYR